MKIIAKATGLHNSYKEGDIVNNINTLRVNCVYCRRPTSTCFCNEIIPINTNSEFIILMHPKEAKDQRVGTGRLAKLCLKNSKIITGVNFSNNIEVNEIIKNPNIEPIVLYPGLEAINLTENPLPDEMENKKLLFIVIDGTWKTAKTIMRESINLHKLPRVSFDVTSPSKFIIKRQPKRFCLSTIESIYELLKNLEKWGYEKLNGGELVLENTLNRLVEIQLGYYKTSINKAYPLKWQKKQILFENKNF